MLRVITQHDLVLAVRELMDRHLDVYQIALRLKLDVSVVQSIIDLIT
jgi:hypothetical protein